MLNVGGLKLRITWICICLLCVHGEVVASQREVGNHKDIVSSQTSAVLTCTYIKNTHARTGLNSMSGEKWAPADSRGKGTGVFWRVRSVCVWRGRKEEGKYWLCKGGSNMSAGGWRRGCREHSTALHRLKKKKRCVVKILTVQLLCSSPTPLHTFLLQFPPQRHLKWSEGGVSPCVLVFVRVFLFVW